MKNEVCVPILKTCPFPELQKGGEWQFYKFHFLVLSSFGLDRIRVIPQVFRVMDARVHEPFYRGLSSSKRVRYWPFKRINYQQLHRIVDKVQSEDLERHELRSLSTYSEKKKETRSTPNGPIFGDLSLSRIKGEKWPSADGHGPSYNWYLSLSFNPFVVHRYPFASASEASFCVVFRPVLPRLTPR